MTVTTAVVVLPRRMAVWATRRALARTSLTGIWLACAIGAAAWFSAGTRGTALAGGAMLAAGYLARRIGKQLAVPARGDDPPEPPAHAPARWEHASGAPRLAVLTRGGGPPAAPPPPAGRPRAREDQYSSASKTVSTRRVRAGSDGSSEPFLRRRS